LIPKDFLKTLQKNEFFLDNVTGDLYEFRKVIFSIMKTSSDWAPMMNIGLHNKLIAEKFSKIQIILDDRGKFILNPDRLRPKSNIKLEQYITINTEVKCFLMKQNLHHWVLKDIV